MSAAIVHYFTSTMGYHLEPNKHTIAPKIHEHYDLWTQAFQPFDNILATVNHALSGNFKGSGQPIYDLAEIVEIFADNIRTSAKIEQYGYHIHFRTSHDGSFFMGEYLSFLPHGIVVMCIPSIGA